MNRLINSNVPEFLVKAFHEKEFKEVSNKTLKGKWSVLFFYPADFTFVCPTELEDLADNYEELKKMNVEVYSVSTDTHFSHLGGHESSNKVGKIKFPMLADPTGKLSRSLGVYIEEEGLTDRATFVINPEGKIKIVELTDGGIGRNAEELIRKIRAAQYIEKNPGEVCPAKWSEGEETLEPKLEFVGKL